MESTVHVVAGLEEVVYGKIVPVILGRCGEFLDSMTEASVVEAPFPGRHCASAALLQGKEVFVHIGVVFHAANSSSVV